MNTFNKELHDVAKIIEAHDDAGSRVLAAKLAEDGYDLWKRVVLRK